MSEKEKKGYEPKGTKVSPAMAKVWDAVCQALGTNTYDLIQQFIYAMIRAASDHHNKSPEIQKLMDALDIDPGWNNAINLCSPNGKFNISQIILIVEQDGKEGYGMVMMDKPYCGGVQQTENTNFIIERVIEVGMKNLYKKLRGVKAEMRCKWLSDVLTAMINAQNVLNISESDRAELPGYDNRHEYGKPVEYGQKKKSIHRRTPDGEANRKQHIKSSREDIPDLIELSDEEPDYGMYEEEP